MAMVSHPVETTGWKKNPVTQYLKGFGGAAVPASEIRVYHLRKDGKQDRFLRTEPATFFSEVPKKGYAK